MRTYDRGEYKLPSVTTVIGDSTPKWGLCDWKCNLIVDAALDAEPHADKKEILAIPSLEAERAADIGTATHNYIEQHLIDGTVPKEFDDGEFIPWQSYMKFREEHKLDPIETEQSIFGDGYAGTLDFYGHMDGELVVMDFKTSNYFYTDYRYQVCAYQIAKDLNATPVVLMLNKNKVEYKIKAVTKKTYKYDVATFKLMLAIYYAKHPLLAKKAGVDRDKYLNIGV